MWVVTASNYRRAVFHNNCAAVCAWINHWLFSYPCTTLKNLQKKSTKTQQNKHKEVAKHEFKRTGLHREVLHWSETFMFWIIRNYWSTILFCSLSLIMSPFCFALLRLDFSFLDSCREKRRSLCFKKTQSNSGPLIIIKSKIIRFCWPVCIESKDLYVIPATATLYPHIQFLLPKFLLLGQ